MERSSSSLPESRLRKALKSSEYSDRIFAVKPTDVAEFIEDGSFLFRGSSYSGEKSLRCIALLMAAPHADLLSSIDAR